MTIMSNGALLAAVLITIGGFIAPSKAWACRCLPVEGVTFETRVAADLGSADYVIAGQVVFRDDLVARIDVDTIWKGDAAAIADFVQGEPVEGGVMLNTCDFMFRTGTRYVVFARKAGPRLRVPPCGLSGTWESATRVVAVLDGLAPPRRPQ